MKKERNQPDKKKAEDESKAAAPAKKRLSGRARGTAKPSSQQLGRAAVQRQVEVRRGLFLAVERLSAEQLSHWLEEPGANVNVRDEQGMTPLHHAAARGARPCIRLLVASGQCDYLIRDNQGRYAFQLAIEWARDYAVGRLLSKKQAQQAHERGVPAFVPPQNK
jgi:ankyrin repeat protein